jgi:hypothetical protein
MEMTVRYVFTTLLAAVGLMGLAATASADMSKADDVQLLFVQSATSGAYDGKTLVELSDPQIKGDRISYQVKRLNGKPPKQFDSASLFIDGKSGAFIGGMVAGHIIHNMRR